MFSLFVISSGGTRPLWRGWWGHVGEWMMRTFLFFCLRLYSMCFVYDGVEWRLFTLLVHCCRGCCCCCCCLKSQHVYIEITAKSCLFSQLTLVSFCFAAWEHTQRKSFSYFIQTREHLSVRVFFLCIRKLCLSILNILYPKLNATNIFHIKANEQAGWQASSKRVLNYRLFRIKIKLNVRLRRSLKIHLFC